MKFSFTFAEFWVTARDRKWFDHVASSRIPHGPHPGTIMASRNATRTEELAVMFDTQHTLELLRTRLRLDDPNIRKAA